MYAMAHKKREDCSEKKVQKRGEILHKEMTRFFNLSAELAVLQSTLGIFLHGENDTFFVSHLLVCLKRQSIMIAHKSQGTVRLSVRTHLFLPNAFIMVHTSAGRRTLS